MDRNVFRNTELSPLTTDLAIPNTEISITSEDKILSPSAMANIMKKPGLMTVYAQKSLAKNASLEQSHEQCRAVLAKDALQNVLGLTILEAHYASMVPQGVERFRAIVNAFAYSAMDRFCKW